MKKLVLLVLVGAIATAVSAQFLIGGQFNIASFKDKEAGNGATREISSTLVTLIPRLAYVSGNIWYGVDAGVSLVNSKFDLGGNINETKSTIATIAPFIRYVKRPVDNFGIWIEGQAGVSFGNEKDDAGSKTAEYTGYNVGLRPGVIFFIVDHLSFEASFGSMGYSLLTVTDPENTQVKETFSQAGLTLNSNSLSLDNTNFGIARGFLFGVNWMF